MEGLNHLVWMCTRAQEGRYAYSLGDGRASPEELDTDEAKRLFGMAADFGVEHLFITGGEPFLRKDVFELMEHASILGLKLYIKTNGWSISANKEIAKQLGNVAAAIKDAGKAIASGEREVR